MSKIINITVGILIILLLISASYLYIDAIKQAEQYQIMQMVDFQETLIHLNLTLVDLKGLINEKNKENELFSQALESQWKKLNIIHHRIYIIDSRLNPKMNSFSEDYSIQELLFVIREIEAMVMSADEEQADLEIMSVAVSNISTAASEMVISSISTGSLSSHDLIAFIDRTKQELKKVRP